MADFGDLASEESEQHLRVALARRPAPVDYVAPPGYCSNCDQPLNNREGRFCDEDCRDDYESLRRARRMAPR